MGCVLVTRTQSNNLPQVGKRLVGLFELVVSSSAIDACIESGLLIEINSIRVVDDCQAEVPTPSVYVPPTDDRGKPILAGPNHIRIVLSCIFVGDQPFFPGPPVTNSA